MGIEIWYYEAITFRLIELKAFSPSFNKTASVFSSEKILCIACTTASYPVLSCKAPAAYIMSILK